MAGDRENISGRITMHTTSRVLHAIADRLLVYIQSDVIHSLRGASEVVLWISLIAESSLSQHLALLADLAFKQSGNNANLSRPKRYP